MLKSLKRFKYEIGLSLRFEGLWNGKKSWRLAVRFCFSLIGWVDRYDTVSSKTCYTRCGVRISTVSITWTFLEMQNLGPQPEHVRNLRFNESFRSSAYL